MSPRTAREWALAYASLGWRVFPVVPGGKRPSYTGWQRDATTDSRLIARHWREEPAPNIGIVTGEAFVAFDIEAAHIPLLCQATRDGRHRIPATPVALTGRRGIHVLLRSDRSSGHLLELGGVHIGELKGGGGFIVVCPSLTTGAYRWLRSPLEVPLADTEPWLDGLVRRTEVVARTGVGRTLGPAEGAPRLAALARAVEKAPEGQRNSLLYWAMRRAIDDGIPSTVAGSVLGRMATSAGLGEREVASTVRSAMEAGTR